VDRQPFERLALQVMEEHRCHTAVIYGSWARGEATPASDVDLLLVRETGATVRDARVVDGVYLDAFVYPESALDTLDPSFLRILDGIVLRERDGVGSELLARVREMHHRGPPPMPDDQRLALVTWSQKMLDRFRASRSVEIDYRRMYLVVRALEDYFALRNAWYEGEKEAFAWLRQHDPLTYNLFERASQLSDSALTDLVAAVYQVVPNASRNAG
jgi:predicted nucleotidyltransferase